MIDYPSRGATLGLVLMLFAGTGVFVLARAWYWQIYFFVEPTPIAWRCSGPAG